MPELPEVESIKLSLAPMVRGKTLRKTVIYNRQLRWPIQADLEQLTGGAHITRLQRRGKYLILETSHGALYLHFGMTGSLVRMPLQSERGKHDHADFIFDDFLLRYNDPRRFGSIEWQAGPSEDFHRLSKLGPEPLSPAFNAAYLKRALSRRKVPIKTALMQNSVVAGVGNIYANEALFRAGIHPFTAALRLNEQQIRQLIQEIVALLQMAIIAGGSSLKDYVDANGKTGSFQRLHTVYGRAGADCQVCASTIMTGTLNGRATFWCPSCQP